MKRIFLPFLVGLLLVSGCTRKSDLPPEEVLRKSADSVSSLKSAVFAVDMSLSAPGNVQLSGKANGTLQLGGKQFAFQLHLTGNVPSTDSDHALLADLDVAVNGEHEAYLRIRSLSFTPPHPAFSPERIQELTGTWWKLPSSASGTQMPSSQVSPDPRLLQAQANVVKVTEDKGIESLDGRDVYHYAVQLDQQKLLAFLQAAASAKGEQFNSSTAKTWAGFLTGAGELWIDHDTSFVRRIVWHFTPSDPSVPVSLSITADVTQQNAAPAVTMPTDAKPWPLPSVTSASSLSIPAAAKKKTSAPISSSKAY